MNEEQRVREEIKEAIGEALAVYTHNYKRMPSTFAEQTKDRAVDRILKTEGIRIEAADQSLPRNPHVLASAQRYMDYDEGRESMLKPDSEGNVWVKCLPKTARE